MLFRSHVIDVVRGKDTEKVRQFGHQALSTFGVGKAFAESQLRAVLRQLLATGAVAVDASAYNTLHLTPASREVLRGQVAVRLRESSASPASSRADTRRTSAVPVDLDSAGQQRLAALKAWRAEVARAHNLPAYVIFHDATLIALAAQAPQSLDALQHVHGMGVKKLQAYGEEVLRVLTQAA